MNTNLIIIGTGEQKEKLKQMIKKLNLEKKFYYLDIKIMFINFYLTANFLFYHLNGKTQDLC